jgi:O-acetylserine/cysteine efflux transporter
VLTEGPAAIGWALGHATLWGWVAVVWQSAGNSWFGYASWAFLLARYPSATISPWALLVPVFGMGAAVLWLGEPMPAWKLAAATLVILGLAVSVFYPRLHKAWLATG